MSSQNPDAEVACIGVDGLKLSQPSGGVLPRASAALADGSVTILAMAAPAPGAVVLDVAGYSDEGRPTTFLARVDF